MTSPGGSFQLPGTAPARGSARRTLVRMSAQPDDIAATPPNMVDIGGEKAVVIPLTEYRAMKALADRATPEEQEDAWFGAAIAEAEEWEAAGRPGGTIPHELVVAEMEAAWRSAGGRQ